MSLIAMSRSISACRAAQTSPIEPFPRGRSRRYFPAIHAPGFMGRAERIPRAPAARAILAGMNLPHPDPETSERRVHRGGDVTRWALSRVAEGGTHHLLGNEPLYAAH